MNEHSPLRMLLRKKIRTCEYSFKELLITIKFEFKEICLTETWCTDDPTNKTFNLENYTSVNQVRKHGRGGGICTFIHSSLTFKSRSDLAINSNDIESLAIEIINKKEKMFPLVHSIDNQWSFIKRHTSGSTSSDNKWQRVLQRVTTNGNEWQRMTTSGTTSDNECTSDNEWQRVTTSDKEWQRVVQRMTTNVNEWPFQLIFLFFQIKEEPTTKYPKENFLNLEEDLEEGLLN